jgi:hypothetical protein
MRFYSPTHGREIGMSATAVSDDPDTQVAQVIDMMRQYSDEDSQTPELYHDAMRAAGPDDPITGNWADVQHRIRFVPDEETAAPFTSFMKGPVVETLVRPIDMRGMLSPEGDCDDFSMTMRARMLALGIPAGFSTVAVDRDDPERYSHVYAIADCSGGVCGPKWDGRVALDASHGPYPGWEAPNPFGKRTDWCINPAASRLAWVFAAGVLIGSLGYLAWWAAQR